MKQFFKYLKNVQHVGIVGWYEGYLKKVPQQTMGLNLSIAPWIKKPHLNAVKE
jgi:hypothetical protein